jgi:hypothetical protein
LEIPVLSDANSSTLSDEEVSCIEFENIAK